MPAGILTLTPPDRLSTVLNSISLDIVRIIYGLSPGKFWQFSLTICRPQSRIPSTVYWIFSSLKILNGIPQHQLRRNSSLKNFPPGLMDIFHLCNIFRDLSMDRSDSGFLPSLGQRWQWLLSINGSFEPLRLVGWRVAWIAAWALYMGFTVLKFV